MKVKSTLPITILLAFFLFAGAAIPAPSLAAEVDVYIQGAYNLEDQYLDVFVFADINNGHRLISWGVTLNYETDQLNPISAEKNPYPNVPYTSNQARWEFGSDAATKDLPNPVFSPANGKVIGKGGVLDEADPTAGNTGPGVLLFWVRFEPGTEAPNLTTPDLSLEYAIGTGQPTDDYKNFVRYDTTTQTGIVLDSTDNSGVEFHPVSYSLPPDIAAYGDANGDGEIDVVDYVAIRNSLTSPKQPPYADCNMDRYVDVVDYVCVRNNL
jgi:hypothetical protein